MTRLLYFTRTQERRREEVFVYFGMEERGVNIVVIEKILIGHLMRFDKEL